MANQDTKFDKFQFDTDFFEVLTPAEIARAEEAESAREQAYAEGFSAGQRQLQEEMQTQLTQQVQTLQQIAEQLQRQQDVYAVALGRQALTIIEQTLNQLLDHAAEHYPQDVLEKHLRDVIPLLPKTVPLILKIHPNATSFHEKLGAPQADIQGCAFTIQTDPNIAPGDCIVVWDNGGIEASLTQAKQQLSQLLNSTPPDPNIDLAPETAEEEPPQPAPAEEPEVEAPAEEEAETTEETIP